MIKGNIWANGSRVARIAKNQLRTRSLGNGSTLLYGEIMGERIRERFHDAGKLSVRRAELEMRVASHADALAHSPRARMTRLSDSDLRDAEAAKEMAEGRRLVEWVQAGKLAKVFPPGEPVTCADALAAWLKALADRKRSPHTHSKNRLRVEGFIAFAKAKHLVDITPEMIERWVYRPGADYTRVTDAQVVRAWLNFCCARSRRWLVVTPFEIDMKDKSATARTKEPGRILSPEQAHAYLQAAREYRGGLLAPYVILTTWLFARESEAQRVTRADMRLDNKNPIVKFTGYKRGTPKTREVTVPANVLPILREAVKDWPKDKRVPFSRSSWTTIRERAGLLQRGKTTRHKRRPVLESGWQSDIARHSGFSYLYQKTGDIKEVCRQAGNSPTVGFKHYLTLPEEGDADRFYANPTTMGPERDTPQ